MKKLKLGDVVVRKWDVGEENLATYVIEKMDEIICTIVPFIQLRYDQESLFYRGNHFITENKPEILVHRNEIASVCCINTELNSLLCRTATSNEESLKEDKIESDIL